LLLIFDNYDSFTYNLCDYFKQLGQEILVIRNDEKSLSEIENLNFDGIVISPGPGIPKNAGILMALIETWHKRKPMLGICLGHQALGQHFGLHLVNAPYPMHGKVSVLKTNKHPMWHNIPQQFEVCRYHSLVLNFNKKLKKNQTSNTLNDPNHVISSTGHSLDDNVNMAFAHKNLPIWGLQFHPEAILSQYGHQILNNWLNAFILHQ
jgi:anthranilate synthase/aminodeoxychorismate synthase-like glutamine amidotransferase